MPPPTATRVPEHSPSSANRQIEREKTDFVALYAAPQEAARGKRARIALRALS